MVDSGFERGRFEIRSSEGFKWPLSAAAAISKSTVT